MMIFLKDEAEQECGLLHFCVHCVGGQHVAEIRNKRAISAVKRKKNRATLIVTRKAMVYWCSGNNQQSCDSLQPHRLSSHGILWASVEWAAFHPPGVFPAQDGLESPALWAVLCPAEQGRCKGSKEKKY